MPTAERDVDAGVAGGIAVVHGQFTLRPTAAGRTISILQAVRAGRGFCAAALSKLQDDVYLMLELRLIEPSGACPFRLTGAGASALAADVRHRTLDQL